MEFRPGMLCIVVGPSNRGCGGAKVPITVCLRESLPSFRVEGETEWLPVDPIFCPNHMHLEHTIPQRYLRPISDPGLSVDTPKGVEEKV